MHFSYLSQCLPTAIPRTAPRHWVAALLVSLCFSAQAVDQYSYRVLDKKPQARDLFVQGLEIHDGLLYLSAGNYGESRLMRYHFDTGELETARKLHPRIFAEGLTVLGDHIYQLTWRERMMLVFNKENMDAPQWFPIDGVGWGLTNNGSDLIYSDGSNKLHYLNPQSRRVEYSVAVTENAQPVTKLNELEWVEGKIWANIWQSNRIVIIDPDTGVVTASVDLNGLLPAAERHSNTDVLNGIARNPVDGSIWVTGKRWPWMYQIELIEQIEPPASRDSR